MSRDTMQAPFAEQAPIPADPLAYTEHELAVIASWAEAPERTSDAIEAEEETRTGFMGTPLGKLAAGTATIVAGIGGGFIASTPAFAHANQIPAPAAKVAQPFELNTAGNILESDTGTVTKQQCIDEAIARPTINHTRMIHAGQPGGQEVSAYVRVEGMDSGCESLVLRKQKSKFVVGGHAMEPIFMTFQGANNEAGAFTTFQVIYGTRGLYRCTPGPKATKAEVEIKEVARDAQTHTSLAEKVYKAPVQQIFPKAC